MNNTSRRPIDWVVCAAGSGLRFKECGVFIKKPLIKLHGKSFLERSLDCLDLLPQDKLIVITQDNDSLIKDIEIILKKFSWIDNLLLPLKEQTSGQLASFYEARSHLRSEASVVIWNCDTYFKSFHLNAMIAENSFDAIVPCGEMSGDKWSFYKTVTNEIEVVDVAEKKRISGNASVGFYYFKNSSKLLGLTRDVLNEAPPAHAPEHYVSLVHKKMLETGQSVVISNVDLFLPFGTIEDIEKYWSAELSELLEENPRGTLVIDLDGTITIDDKSKPYSIREPNLDVVSRMQEYSELGFKIIIYTARNMRTQLGDESLVIGNIGKETILWLDKHNIPYDGLRFAKPFAENGFYIDDRAIRPSEFLADNYENLLKKILDE